MAKQRVLVVEDDPNVCELVTLYLEREGLNVECVHDGAEALTHIQTTPPDLIVLDLMLPSVDGLEICRRVRQEQDTPIVMLTARGDEIDRILGLEMGADDYLPKPFNPRELTARVKAVLRRSKPQSNQSKVHNVLTFRRLKIDQTARVVYVDGEEITLTPKEFDLLWHMASHIDRTFTRPELLESIWGFDFYGDERTVDVHIKRLRRKVERSTNARYIHTIWGVGYKFKPEESASDE